MDSDHSLYTGITLHNDLVTLNRIVQTLNREADVYSALNSALAQLVDLMGLQTGWVFLRTPDSQDAFAGPGYELAAHRHLPPALALDDNPAWRGGCSCQATCQRGELTAAYNEVQCSRLREVIDGETYGLTVHASAPLHSGDDLLGIVNVAAPNWSAFSKRTLALLENVANQMGIAVARARLYDMVQAQRSDEQHILLRFSTKLLSQPDLDDMTRFLVQEIARLMQVEACALLLPSPHDPDSLYFRAAVGWHSDPVGQHRRISVHHSGSGKVMRSLAPMLVQGLDNEDAEKAQQALPDIKDWLDAEGFVDAAIVPMVVDNRAIGTLVIDTREPRGWTPDDVRFLKLMANQAALALETARLRHESWERQRMSRDLEVGRNIQLSLLPRSCPVIEGWEFAAQYEPARRVGGDFYDFFAVQDERNPVGLLIADVAGKGVPAAIIMALSRTVIRATTESGRAPAAALRRANELILRDSQSGMFLSAVYARLDPVSGHLWYTNAGHNPPLLLRTSDTDCTHVPGRGTVLGALSQISLEDYELGLEPGDAVLFYTDGALDAINTSEEGFGTARLREVMLANRGATAEALLDAVMAAIRKHVGDTEQADDITLVAVRRCPG